MTDFAWYIFRGSQTAIRKTRDALDYYAGPNTSGATIVLGGRDYFYAKVDTKYFEDMTELRRDTKVSMELCDAPEYRTAYCGKLTAAVEKHQYACHACIDVRKKNVAWSKKTLEDEIAKTAPVDQEPVAEDAATTLTSFVDLAIWHRDEHLGFAAKWDAYLTAFKDLNTDTLESLRQLKEAQEQLDKAQLRYNVTNFRVEQLLQTGDDD